MATIGTLVLRRANCYIFALSASKNNSPGLHNICLFSVFSHFFMKVLQFSTMSVRILMNIVCLCYWMDIPTKKVKFIYDN